MIPTSSERVLVGVDGSPESIAALRTAAQQARCRRARLCVVYVQPHVKLARDPDRYSEIGVMPSSPTERNEWLLAVSDADAEARAVVESSLKEALGEEAHDLVIDRLVPFGKPGPALVGQAWRYDDLLVVGSRGGPRWAHPLRRSVSRYCATHANGPVLVVHDHPTGGFIPGQRPTSGCSASVAA